MDKVIIDRVDVSGCEHYRAEIETKMPYGEYEIQKDKCYYSGIEIIQKCKGNKGCIYKQLKRLEQENERLKEENYGLNQELLGYKKGVQASEIIELKQALQEIREYATDLVDGVTGGCETDIGTILLKRVNSVIGAEE